MISGITRHVGGQLLLAQADAQGDRVETPTPVPLVAVAPGPIGVGLGLGHFVQGSLADGRHEVERAIGRGGHARRRERQFAAAEDGQIGVDRARLHGALHQGVKLRGLQLGQNGAGAGARESAIRQRGPHHRRIVASLRKASAVSSASPSG